MFQVKGYSISRLDEDVASQLEPSLRLLYERVWDEADYVVPPAENGAFFVTTNVVITPNQTLGHCAEVTQHSEQSSCHTFANNIVCSNALHVAYDMHMTT